jgi:pyruvate/oxaloacetate carboxyltransferase
MLLRGQNLVGYRNYADDVVEAFVQRSCDNGIDLFRVFDALNDFRNFETAVRVIKKNGMHFQGTICYSLTERRMGGDVYNLDYYLNKAKELVAMGADSICIKDMAGSCIALRRLRAGSGAQGPHQCAHSPAQRTSPAAWATSHCSRPSMAGVDVVDTAWRRWPIAPVTPRWNPWW